MAERSPLVERGSPRWGSLEHLEGLFNPAGQQRAGLIWSLLKARPGRDRNDPVLAGLARGAFNTNPVLAGYLAGCLALRLSREAESQGAGRQPGVPGGAGPEAASETTEAVERIRILLAPLLAGIGDRVMYGGIRPLLSLAGIYSALIWLGDPAVWYWLGYNAVQLYWRRRSWSVGIRGEEAVRAEIRSRILERWATVTARAARFLLGLALGAAVTGIWLNQGAAWSAVFLAVCLTGLLIMRSGRVPPLLWGWLGLAVAGLMALLRLGLERGKV